MSDLKNLAEDILQKHVDPHYFPSGVCYEAVIDAITEALNITNSQSLRICHIKENDDGEITLVRDSHEGLKYLIFDDDGISYANIIGEGKYELTEFNGSNAKKLINSWGDKT